MTGHDQGWFPILLAHFQYLQVNPPSPPQWIWLCGNSEVLPQVPEAEGISGITLGSLSLENWLSEAGRAKPF